MSITFQMAERAAGYYCAVRDLEDKLGDELGGIYTDHPQWDELSDQLWDQWDLSDDEVDVLHKALDAGLCDYFGPEDILHELS
jgi:hypothetical protein